jgi:hypothetical protein
MARDRFSIEHMDGKKIEREETIWTILADANKMSIGDLHRTKTDC